MTVLPREGNYNFSSSKPNRGKLGLENLATADPPQSVSPPMAGLL